MPRSSNQKLKLLYVMDFLLRCSDEEHPVTVNQIIDCLAEKDIPAERKSIYDDIEALRLFGLDVIQVKGGGVYGYYVGDRDFQLPELKLLVDSVQSSKFITHKKTVSLIKKIESLASVYQARQLSRQVFVANRIKTMNESIYYNVDEIHSGIAQNRQIRFRYFDYTVDKKRRFRREGDFYQVSPFALTWDDENYYMVAYDSQAQVIKHFRVDKMVEAGLLDEVRSLLAMGLPRNATAMQAIGYKEFLGVLDGTLTKSEALELVKLRSRQYAKRQLTWLRKNPAIHWIYWEKERDFARALQISTEILTASGLG